MDVYENLRKLALEIPAAPSKGGAYVPVKTVGDLLFVSGQGPIRDGKLQYVGKVGGERTLEEGREAARLCMLNLLAQVEDHLGDLNKVKNVVKVLGFVSSVSDFNSQPKVIDAGSELLVDVFGDRGVHTRSAVGTNALPNDITVEIEAILEIEG
ncbi:MAG: RidA family protein [Spirochaetota bacterium]